MKKFFLIPFITAASMLLTPLNVSAVSYSLPQTEFTTVTAIDNVNAERVAALVNKVRRDNGLSELKIFPLLSEAASVRARELSVSFAHTRPDGTRFLTVLDDYGIPWGSIAENAAFGQPTPESAITSWLNSENHRKNLLNPNFNYIGVGAYEVNGTYYWDQIFVQSSDPVNGAAVPRNIGDANLDGRLDGNDATLVLTDYTRTSVGKASSLSEQQRGHSDMNGDRKIDAIDASAILTAYVKASVG